MKSFSERYGHKPARASFQIDSMDQDLRTGLWNVLMSAYWKIVENSASENSGFVPQNTDALNFLQKVWGDLLKRELDTMNTHWTRTRDDLKAHFFACEWNAVYDFIEFVVAVFPYEAVNSRFLEACNKVLEREGSAYRFINKQITPIVSETEISTIEEALDGPDKLKPVRIHLENALSKLSDRQNPDYRNSIKESISAVEAICNLITGNKATLGDVLKQIQGLHPALKESFSKLYGYTNDADGIRHALLDEEDLKFEDAKFMLVSCSAFVNYLAANFFKSK